MIPKEEVVSLAQQDTDITWIVYTCEKCRTQQIKRFDKVIKNCLSLPPICCRMCFGNCQPDYVDNRNNKQKAVLNHE